MLRNQDRPMIAFVLQSARKKDFASAKVREGAAERKGNVYRFLTSTSKEQMLAWRPVYTVNPLSLASICVGSPLVLSNAK